MDYIETIFILIKFPYFAYISKNRKNHIFLVK